MPLEPGQQIAHYRVVEKIGEGGMGEVYRATDTKLKREVAIKVLPEEVGRDRDRLARFEREAQVLASLNHPNIASIYGLEEASETPCLVLELVEGHTLAERLAQGALPLEEARDVALQIASALEMAHEKGIVHRDLKPANVKVTPEGAVKVLDFGLAKALENESAETAHDLSLSPTLTAAATRAGVILGTAAYMSPEQARGKSVDKRTDIWAFGCVFYECLTTRRCFTGETVSDLIAHVLQTEPDWEALPAETPDYMRRLLRRCLEKDRRHRLRDIGDARIELEDEFEPSMPGPGVATATPSAVGWSGRIRLALFGTLLVAASVLATVGVQRLLHPSPARAPVRFQVADAEGMTISKDGSNHAISPDGTMLVFLAGDSARQELWVRSLETLAAHPLEGTDDGYQPFWSPDSRHIGFFSFGKLKRVPAEGGVVEELCNSGFARGGTWNRQNVILYAPSSGPLLKVSASGGDSEPITSLDTASGETAHRFPHFLPDGQRYLYSSLPPKDGKFDIYVGELGSAARQFLVSVESGVVYAGSGHLLFQRNGSLAAQEFDTSSLRLGDEPVIVRQSMALTGFAGGPGFSVSSSGTLAFATLNLQDTRLAWFDREGREVTKVPMDPAPYTDMQISPDDRRVALVRQMSASKSDIWIGDLERGVVARFSQEPGSVTFPRWSPDGTRIAYQVGEMGPESFVIRSVDSGPEARTILQTDPNYKVLSGWSPDGGSLIYASQDPETRFDLWVLPLDGDQEPWPYLKSPFMEFGGPLSPDGHWIMYWGNESGHGEGYVQAFPDPGIRYQVTKGGGRARRWLAAGTQLVFSSKPNPTTLQVADVIPGQEFRLGPARTFGILPRGELATRITNEEERILSLVPAGDLLPNSITVVLNWAEELGQD
jgi:Tol biopolymer transport system component/tRNA A-37 threonylcarbamoyl transferase component Bud32